MERKKVSHKDFLDICDVIWEQFQEDRGILLGQYHDLRGLVSGSIEKYATVGDPLAKFSEQILKQTAQVIEFVKLLKKEKESDDTFTQEDFEAIEKEIKNK